MKNCKRCTGKYNEMLYNRWIRKQQRKTTNEFIDVIDESFVKIGYFLLNKGQKWHEPERNMDE